MFKFNRNNESDIDEAFDYELDQDRVESHLNNVIEHYTKIDLKSLNLVQRGIKSKRVFIEEVREFLLRSEHDELIIEEVIERLKRFLWGYYILEDLIEDETISDIKVLRYDNIRIKRHGVRMNSDIKFQSPDKYKQFVNAVAVKNQKSLSDINAIQTFTDKKTSSKFILRFNITTEYINSTESPYIHIRKIAKNKQTIQDLIAQNMMDVETAAYLVDKAKNGKGIIFTGKGASGKTTLMNALIDEIPHTESGLVIQENEELFSNTHPDMMFQHVVQSNGEGKIKYTLKELAINGLLIDLDYFIIGEIKGAEALYFFNASYTGHKCWASIHGNSANEALNKLADYVKYESSYSSRDILKMLTNISCIVFMEKYKVKEISEIWGWDESEGDLRYRTMLSETERNFENRKDG